MYYKESNEEWAVDLQIAAQFNGNAWLDALILSDYISFIEILMHHMVS